MSKLKVYFSPTLTAAGLSTILIANGVWATESGAKFQFQLSGKVLKVQLTDGKSTKYLKYELSLTNQDEVNTYKGGGYFVAKLSNGKECRFDTQWNVIVVQPDRVLVNYIRITPNPDTCAVVEQSPDTMMMTKDTASKP